MLNKKGTKKRFSTMTILLPLLAILVFITDLTAQTDGVDNNYAPLITSSTAAGPSSESLQPDGKLIVSGNFTLVNGEVRPSIVRLNTDGSVDPSFKCTVCTFGAISTLVQPDGKIVVAGLPPEPSLIPVMVRLNPDGSQDASFVNGMRGTGQQQISIVTGAPDGKIYMIGTVIGTFRYDRTLFRLNADGTMDTNFTRFVVRQWENEGFFAGFTILQDGRLFIYGKTTYGFLAQMNSDGSKNTAFESPSVTIPPGPGPFTVHPYILSFGMQSDGKPIFTGFFDTVNGLPKNYVARLNTDGGVDTGYTPQPAFGGSANQVVKVYSGDKTLFVRYDTAKKLIRNNPDGSVDKTYSAPDELTNVSRWELLPNDKLLVYGEYNGVFKYIRLNADGSLDPGFTSPTFEREGSVKKIVVGADGKSIIYGDFGKVDGTPRAGIARLNADGTLDTAFDPGTGFGAGSVVSMAVQSDGKIVAGGHFNSYNGSPHTHIMRINVDGSPDNTFNPDTSQTVNSVVIQPDGKIVIGGEFFAVNSVAKPFIARLHSDGALDDGFNPIVALEGNRYVRYVFVQGDGKIMFGGNFSGVNGFNRTNLARLNSDGTLDTAFNAGSISSIAYVSQLSDGKYLIQQGNVGLKRLLSTGAVDNTFTTPSVGFLDTIHPSAGGTILIGGNFTTVNGTAKNYLARILPDGALDILFNPNGTNKRVWALAAQADGNVIVGGDFYQIGSLGRTNLARLLLAPVAHATPFDFDGDGRADISVTRPSEFNWYQLTGINYNFTAVHFGSPGDRVAAADFDGDGKTDIAVFRPDTGDWWYITSADGTTRYLHWGQNGDLPLPGDFNGDGKADFVVVRDYLWWVANSSGQVIFFNGLGQAGDKPISGDFDGDGKTDMAVYRPSTGNWIYAASGSGGAVTAIHWGVAEDIPAPADYDGDGKTDLAVFRPSEGNWYVLKSGGGYIMLHFGATGDKPVAADYDGDGKADLAVYRPSDGYWYLLRTTEGFTGFPFGISSDIPTPNALIVP